MKTKLLLIGLLSLVMTVAANAQIPNSGFENWTTTGSYENPTGWWTTNVLSTGSFYAVTKSTDHYPATVGAYSVRMENNITILDESGMGLLTVAPFDGDMYPNFPITGHPTSLTGYYKFTPQNGDTMTIAIQLYYNAGIHISTGVFTTTASASNWTPFNIPIPVYTTADSADIMIASFNIEGSSPHGNSVLYIDNLNFDNLISSVSELYSENTALSLFPNPATDVFSVTGIEGTAIITLSDLSGKLLLSKNISADETVSVSTLPNGIYLATVKSKDITETEKLVIQH